MRRKSILTLYLIASMLLANFTPVLGAETKDDDAPNLEDVVITSASEDPADAERAARDAEAEKIADEVISKYITDDMDEFEKAYYIFEWITHYSDIEYNYTKSDYIGCTDEYGYITWVSDARNWDIGVADKVRPAIDSQEFADQGYIAITDIEFNKKYSPDKEDGYYFRIQPNGTIYYSPDRRYMVYKKIPSNELQERVKELVKDYGRIYNHEAYGALVQKCCTCEGYSRAFKIFLDKLGIENELQEVLIAEGPHMWNQLTINGKTFVIDSTGKSYNISATITDRSQGEYKDSHELAPSKGHYWVIEFRPPIWDLHREIYGTIMKERTVFGEVFGGYDPTINKHKFGNGNYYEIDCETMYNGKKPDPEVRIYYNGVMYSSKDKSNGIVLKIKHGKRAYQKNDHDNERDAIVFIKKIKCNNEILKAIIAAEETTAKAVISTRVVPFEVSSNNIKVKLKDTTVKSVQVNFGDGKYKKVPKKMWKQDGSNLIFDKNFKGTVPITN